MGVNKEVLLIDYGMGNLFSIKKVVERLGYVCLISKNPNSIRNARRIILPGVGHFGKAMTNLKEGGLVEPLQEAALIRGIPILGICLGMQLMTNNSEEGDARGLGWFNADVVRFNTQDKKIYKVPHIGWNSVSMNKPSLLMAGIEKDAEFYFVHSYYCRCKDENDILNTTDYESVFTSAIERQNIFGVQYHPEKSHGNGEKLIENFIKL